MFWGITLESGKKYTQVLQRSFHVTMAALGFENPSPDPVSVVVDINMAQYVLCTLQAGKIPQQNLDLNFTEGEEVSFSIEGDGEVHLTGYLLPDPQEYEFSDDDDDDGGVSESEQEQSEDESKSEEEDDYEKTVEVIKKDIASQKMKKKSNEPVSNVSWQGVLSGSVEHDDDEDDDWHPNSDLKVSKKTEQKTKKKSPNKLNEKESSPKINTDVIKSRDCKKSEVADVASPIDNQPEVADVASLSDRKSQEIEVASPTKSSDVAAILPTVKRKSDMVISHEKRKSLSSHGMSSGGENSSDVEQVISPSKRSKEVSTASVSPNAKVSPTKETSTTSPKEGTKDEGISLHGETKEQKSPEKKKKRKNRITQNELQKDMDKSDENDVNNNEPGKKRKKENVSNENKNKKKKKKGKKSANPT